jgi:hypothetical protein
MTAPSWPPSRSFDDTIFEFLLCSLTSSRLVPCVIQTTLKVRLKYVCSHPCTLFAATFLGADTDTLCSSCSVILSVGCGVLDVGAVGARCSGRLITCGILSSSIIAYAIRVLALSIAVADIIADL